MAEVTYSTDLHWYRLALPLTNSQSPSQEPDLTRSSLTLARTASDGHDLYLLADVPVSAPESLAASLAIWGEDVKRITACIAGNEEEAEFDKGLSVLLSETDAARVVEVFLRDVEADWRVTREDDGCAWRLVRRSDASRRLPPVCHISPAGAVTSFMTVIPLDDESPADILGQARSLFLLRLSAGWLVAGRLLPGGAELRATLPVPDLQSTHLRAAYDALLDVYRFSALELQALGDEPLASLYVRLQADHSLGQ
jgi:hypothetical protein